MPYSFRVTSPLATVTSALDVNVTATADIVFSVAVSAAHSPVQESLTMTVDGNAIGYHEILAGGRTRLHRAPSVPPGLLRVEYSAQVAGPGELLPHGEAEEILYRRPSRYCDSDRLSQIAYSYFKGLSGAELVEAVRDWVATKILYTLGSSRGVDGALDTYLSRKGVCRDMGHLVVTFCRAMNVPARLVSVYAPGLAPMDFHAVAEVLLDGVWYVVDATGLAPRQSMVRIATGRDASDTAFMTTVAGRTQFKGLRVGAVVEGELPVDDPATLVELGQSA